MTSNWFILADDLTGAADSGVAFAKRGLSTIVTWQHSSLPDDQWPAVLAYNAASRELSVSNAMHAQLEALERHLREGTVLFKKIDSTLRGQPAAEIRLAWEYLRGRGERAFGIVAPAYPALGRTTQNAHTYVDGVPLEQTEIWARDHSYVSADLLKILASVGLKSQGVSLTSIRGARSRLIETLREIADREAFAVCDALTAEDLDALASASTALASECFYVGSGGLAQALARTCGTPASNVSALRSSASAGALIVVGSLATASRLAARELSRDARVTYMQLDAEQVLADDSSSRAESFTASVTEALVTGKDVLVEIVFARKPELALIPALVNNLAGVIGPCALKASAIAATGGETAAAVLQGMNVPGIRLLDEIDPGICLGITMGASAIPVVTKAGAFGDEHSLVRIAERLREIRQIGSVQ